ncbi:MAG: class I tRNA ligase family protein [Phycisphaerales bacterium]|nr:MAG: class I tRNA ligase family protein [Phycisphaerales bacterium]
MSNESTPTTELPKQYRPIDHEDRIWSKWESANAFHADPARVLRGEARPYAIVIPPPNVTAALHLGHALNNSLQDILVRAKRMQGFETLWMPGTDHAGIATQAVVEKRLRKEGALKGPLRDAFTRDQFVEKIQAFKDEYEAIITSQLKKMGCSCDWARQRFTMDDQCARAVREAFFRLFRDGLIYRGKRLVNWDPALQTAVADDECYDEEIDGAFYYLRYPLVHLGNFERTIEEGNRRADAQPMTWGELARRGYEGASAHPPESQAWITVATTRPETYLGDTAVAVNPHDPRAGALKGLHVELPLVGRLIPIVEDSYVVLPERFARTDEEKNDPKARMATGFLKVTPAHDPNDYEIGQRHKQAIEALGNPILINVMAPDATISDKHGWEDTGDARLFLGLSREQARKKTIEEFKARTVGYEPLFEGSKPHRHSVKHSDRSKAIVEPYLSDQWYVKVTDPRMAKAANDALQEHSQGGPALGGTALQSGVRAIGGTALQSGVRTQTTPHPSPSISTLLHHLNSLNFAHLRSAGFTSMDPYPPGKPSPDFMNHIRNLPHIEMRGATYFVTWRVASDDFKLTPKDQSVILESLFHDSQRATVFAATVMPDHVHCIVKPTEALGDWVGSIKKYTARRINADHNRTGHLWQDERFDHIVRDEAWFRSFLEYMLLNPVEEGLCARGDVYPGLRVGDEVLGAMGVQDTALESGATRSGATRDNTLTFHPDRYAKTYEQWHDNIRDWCISRQLWWGHRIPVWSKTCQAGTVDESFLELDQLLPDTLEDVLEDKGAECSVQFIDPASGQRIRPSVLEFNHGFTHPVHVYVALLADVLSTNKKLDIAAALERNGWNRDPDVLDTWFSSALWPMSTMGWPDATDLLRAFNPTSTLCTAREIITLWVSRMVMFNRYLMPEGWPNATDNTNTEIATGGHGLGPVPFFDVFIHAVIQDGDGRKMSKSLGNGVDPLDIIATHGADAMRFTLCQMTTQTQDVRMPVARDPATGKNTSPKFDLGRNFATKLWNATRFALTFLSTTDTSTAALTPASLSLTDRWMLSRLARATAEIDRALDAYEFSTYAQSCYALLWNDLCDWYLEAIKPTIADSPSQRAVLAHALETIVRLLHPIMPFVTETIWEKLKDVTTAPIEGVMLGPSRTGLLVTAGWPILDMSLIDDAAEARFARVQSLITLVREVRAQHKVPPKQPLTLHAPTAAALHDLTDEEQRLVMNLTNMERISSDPAPAGVPSFNFEGAAWCLTGIATAADDPALAAAEAERHAKRLADLTKTIATLEGRLANPGYAQKAPPHMVQQTKDQLAAALAERASLGG